MVYQSINDLAPTYLTEMFSRLSDTCKRELRNTRSDLELPMRKSVNGSFDNKEIGGQNLSRFTMSSMTKATLSIYSHRGFVLALPKLVKNAT